MKSRLYAEPANTFVAGFIGSPAMNLVRSGLENGGGALRVRLGPHALRVPESLLAERPALRRHVGREVVLGIRPEDLEDASLAPRVPDERALDVTVTLAEPLGAEVIAHVELEGSRPDDGPGTAELVARLSPRTRAEAGSALRLAVDVERLHFFDAETEAAIR